MEFLDFDTALVINHSIHLPVAYILALPLGWDREKSDRHYGLRTFPLEAAVTCGFMLVGMSVIESTDGEARIIQGIITAASIWNTGAIDSWEDRRDVSPGPCRATGRRVDISAAVSRDWSAHRSGRWEEWAGLLRKRRNPFR